MLIALVARVDAAPDEQALAMARRYADALAGGDRTGSARSQELDDADEADDADDADDLGEEDDAVSAAEVTDRAEAEPGAPRGDPLDRTLHELIAADDAGGDADPHAGAPGDPAPDPVLGEPGPLALLDAEQAPDGRATGDDASFAAAAAGALETYEAWMRRYRPTLWGRLDLGVDWRRGYHAPRHAPAYRSDEIWLFATWRR
ncbi:MAG TPA: hypothetical protein VFK02_00960 [Kofleriaceae bacterium]|nr:hypothetical protein [Kofleriaceae bacterium]